jgi:peptide/nickel transport system substrate-binding protein
MRHTVCPLIVAISLLRVAAAPGATRPHYGGTLHVQMVEAVRSLEPTDSAQQSTATARDVLSLIFDTLVTLNDHGQAQPALALSWQPELGNQRWEFILRPGVMFSDGTPMTAEAVTASLRRANPDWKILSRETSIVIQLDAPSPDLPAQLALTHNAIAKLDAGNLVGTGPFVVSDWDSGKKLALTARDDYWGGRAFLDSVEIQMARNFRDEAISYDLGQSQVIEIPTEQANHAKEARELHASRPTELVALLFSVDVRSQEDAKQRQALALSIDRGLLNQVVLQRAGEPAGGLLPDWLTGYGFLFPQTANLPRAQQLRAEVPRVPLWNLSFDANDPLARVLAERIALNASDAGLRIQLMSQGTPDIRLVRIPLISLDPRIALEQVTRSLGLPAPTFLGNSVDDLYHAENAMLQSQRVIPLLHLRTAWAVSKNVKGWEDSPDESWHLPDVWLAAGKP